MTAEGVSVGAQLRALRAAFGLSLAVCTERSGVGQGHLSKVETDTLPLTASVAWRLAGVLGPTVLQLCESRRLLRSLYLESALRRRELDFRSDEGITMQAFLLPGGVVIHLPLGFPERIGGGPRLLSAAAGQ